MRCAIVGRLGLAATLALAGSALAPPVAGAAAAARTFRPRIGFAMGIVPPLNRQDIATGSSVPVVYHGGDVMRNVTVHTVFWAPPGYRFTDSPGAGALGYEALIKQFLTDSAHDGGVPGNIFSTLTQYPDQRGAASDRIAYDPAVDSIDLTAPYPQSAGQCASPSGVRTCITDLALQNQLDRLIGPHDSGARGLSNIWLVFLPPDVDECAQAGQCATNAFAGYHSLFDHGHGSTVYVAVPDPLVELTPGPGSDPQGNPEGESTIDTVAHEVQEAITDPTGTAWMDPNGFETADKCENGPEQGTPLGYAPDGSPYNHVINGHEYLLQDMWSNADKGCVASSTASSSALPLHTVNLRQYSSAVSGSIGVARRVSVDVVLFRSGLQAVAIAQTETRADGSWGPVRLRSRSGSEHAVGDDRELIGVLYGGSRGAPAPAPDLISTANGGNPFTQSGYTGWFDLDHGFAVGSRSVELGPCSQIGVLSLRVGRLLTQPPAQRCGTETNASVLSTGPIGPATTLTLGSQDNRATSPLAPDGALVKLTIQLGEPQSAPARGNAQLLFLPTGFPTCTAFPRIGTVRCGGLVPAARYTLEGHGARADGGGSLAVSGLHLSGGDVMTLRNRAGRRLTSLHIAHLRVDIIGNQTQIASGRCQPGDYYGPPIDKPPISSVVGNGIGGSGTICPASGDAQGLPTRDIAQADDFSGGQTVISVPLIESTAPLQDETLYGAFRASAQSGLPGPAGSIAATGTPIALTITGVGSRRPVFHSANVDTARGVRVRALPSGAYTAKWVLHDAAGDTRTLTTRFDSGSLAGVN